MTGLSYERNYHYGLGAAVHGRLNWFDYFIKARVYDRFMMSRVYDRFMKSRVYDRFMKSRVYYTVQLGLLYA